MTIEQFLMFLNGRDSPAQIAAVLSNSENLFLAMVLESEAEGRQTSVITKTGIEVSTIMQPGNSMLLSNNPVTPPFDSYVLKTTRMSVAIRLDSLPSITLGLNDDAAVMVTTQLNGCTLVFQPSSEASPYVKIVHLAPNNPKAVDAGKTLNRDLLNADPRHFAGENKATQVFGRLDMGDRAANANIIALRRDRKWTLYAQLIDANRNVLGVMSRPMYKLSD
jgi:hypothetical protein